jgi:MOSC domain-containing protein YiiM
MARPKIKEATKQYTVMLHPSTIEEIDKYAEQYGLTRSQFMRNMIVSGLDDIKLLNKLGIMQTVNIGHTLVEKTIKMFKSKKIDLNKEGEIEIRE